MSTQSIRSRQFPPGLQPPATTLGSLMIGVIASLAFGVAGAFVKPLLESGWSPAAAVAMRTLIGGLVLLPFAVRVLRGRWGTVWVARWRILGLAVVGVVITQLAYFTAIERIRVGTAILIEYLAPTLLVVFAWAVSRRRPKAVVIVGALVSIVGLVLVVGPGGSLDPIGVLAAGVAAVGLATYYLIAARPDHGLPPVAFAAAGLMVGSGVLALAGLSGLLTMTADFGTVSLLGGSAPWWVPMGVVAVMATAVAYATSIAATARLGSRLMSFIGLLEVVFAALFAWLLLGEALSVLQIVGGVVILGGIALVHSERPTVASDKPEPSLASGAMPSSARD